MKKKPALRLSLQPGRFLTFAIGVWGSIAPKWAALWALGRFLTPRRIERPPWENDLVATGQVRDFPGGVKAVVWGEGPTIILAHGWQGRGTQLGKLIGPLTQLGFQVMAVDAPAHGFSSGRQTSISDFANVLCEIGRELGSVAGIIGHSFGGAAAAMAVASGLDAKKMVLIAAPADLNRVMDTFFKRIGLPPSAQIEFRNELERRTNRKIDRSGIRQLGDQLQLPILVLHDPEDPDVKFKSAEETVASCPNATLLPMPGLGHRKILKADAMVNAVSRFFSEI